MTQGVTWFGERNCPLVDVVLLAFCERERWTVRELMERAHGHARGSGKPVRGVLAILAAALPPHLSLSRAPGGSYHHPQHEISPSSEALRDWLHARWLAATPQFLIDRVAGEAQAVRVSPEDTMGQILRKTARRFGVTREEVLEVQRGRPADASRAGRITAARREAMYLSWVRLGRWAIVARYFRRNHSTVMYSVQAHAREHGLPVPSAAARRRSQAPPIPSMLADPGGPAPC